MSVGVNPPKTPVTKGSKGIAAATMPNVCKMPGPPAPFVPTPLPNIGDSGDSPDGYSKSVSIEGEPVAIRGASFKSQGDIASKGTGGGLVSSNTHGPTTFVSPGSMDVKIEGKNVHLLSDGMLNNCGPSGNPANSSTLPGLMQGVAVPMLSAEAVLRQIARECEGKEGEEKGVKPTDADGKKKSCLQLGREKHECCEKKIQDHRDENPPDGQPPLQGETGYQRPPLDERNRPVLNADGSYPAPIPTNAPRPDLSAAFTQGGRAIKEAFAALKGNCYPDAAVIHPNGSRTFVDFKFPCPQGHPSGKGTSNGGVTTTMGPRQQGSYDSLGLGSGGGMAITITP